MKIIFILVSLFIITVSEQTLSAQINSQGNTISKKELKLIPEKEVPKKLQKLTKETFKLLFNSLVPKDNVKFYYEDLDLLAKIDGKYYFIIKNRQFTQNAKYIGFFFKNINPIQKAKDIVYFSYNFEGNIIMSKLFFEEYIKGIKEFKPNLIVPQDKIVFYPFEATQINDRQFQVTVTYMTSFEISTRKYITNDYGILFIKENNIYVKEPQITYITNLSVSKEIAELADLKDKIRIKVEKKISKERKRIIYQPTYFNTETDNLETME